MRDLFGNSVYWILVEVLHMDNVCTLFYLHLLSDYQYSQGLYILENN